MTRILVFTGNAGSGIATAAAAAALRGASQGQRTLLLSLGPAYSLSALLGVAVGGSPAEIAPRLDALAIDSPAEMSSGWERVRGQMHGEMPPIAGDELPLPPGIEMLFGMLRLGELAARYDLVVLDGGAHDLLLRMLAIPDGLRWIIRLLLGLDRGPGRSSASVGRALLPTSFMPTEMIGNTQELRVKIERLRALVTAPGASSAQFVLRPDRPALEEARMAIPALHLHGLAVGAIVAGPLLPAPLAGSSFAAHEDALLSEASAIWPALPLLRFELTDGDPGLASLGALGDGLDHGDRLLGTRAPAPIAEQWQGAPAVAIALPGLPKGALQLTISGDELIVRVGPYRRHILMPEPLRGVSNIRATREDEHLVVRRR
ncbi:MAG: ArsA family ATPase [Kouleothrix sp.]|nr:ArsA family ATPase [Kouleothrix sp.]